jgi:hypothetical protein
MEKEMDAMEKAVLVSSLKTRFFIFVQIGGIMILMTALNPAFWANIIPAIFMLSLSIVLLRWKGAKKVHGRLIYFAILFSCIWIGANTTQQWFLPPVVSGPTRLPVVTTSEITWSAGLIGHVLGLVGSYEVLPLIKMMD